MGTLFIVPTPVGNLKDMTYRAVETLRDADLILCEDTRTSSVLLRHYDIHTPTESHHKFNEHARTPRIIERLRAGENIALVSDAGTPGISDPGFMLSRECRREGIDVVCLPGPTAFVPALVASGLPCDRFLFEGFLPLKKGRATRLAALAAQPATVIIYESPTRLPRTLRQLAETFGPDRPAAVCREISKLHETIHRDTLSALALHFEQNQPKGEIVIIIEGAPTMPSRSRAEGPDGRGPQHGAPAFQAEGQTEPKGSDTVLSAEARSPREAPRPLSKYARKQLPDNN